MIGSKSWRDTIPDLVAEAIRAVEILAAERFWSFALGAIYS
jgi:hypothetical protein